jgi:hypothetical protein
MKSKIVWIVLAAFIILLTFFYNNIPFFWDGAFYSEAASYYYNHKGVFWNCPETLDNATAPIFSYYLFLVWSVFQKTLFVSHLAMLPIFIGAFLVFYLIARKFLANTTLWFALILFVVQPTILTQYITMGYDIGLLFLFLLLIHLIINGKSKNYFFIAPFLALYSPRGLILFFSIILLDYFMYSFKSLIIILKKNLLAISLLIFWFLFHYYTTCWLLFVPSHSTTDEFLLSSFMMLKQFLFIIWKLIDLGQLILWLVFFVGIYLMHKKQKINAEMKNLLAFLIVPLAISSLCMIPFANPIAHRYFLFAYVILILVVCKTLQELATKKIQIITVIFICAFLFSGNFWIYPQRFGNGWDASLKVIPFFEMRDKMDEFIIAEKINPTDVGTQFPLIDDKRFTHLTTTSFKYENVWKGPLSNYNYFLYSNIINTDIQVQFDEARRNWTLVKTYHSGLIELSLYKNPSATSQ